MTPTQLSERNKQRHRARMRTRHMAHGATAQRWLRTVPVRGRGKSSNLFEVKPRAAHRATGLDRVFWNRTDIVLCTVRSKVVRFLVKIDPMVEASATIAAQLKVPLIDPASSSLDPSKGGR